MFFPLGMLQLVSQDPHEDPPTRIRLKIIQTSQHRNFTFVNTHTPPSEYHAIVLNTKWNPFQNLLKTVSGNVTLIKKALVFINIAFFSEAFRN